MAYETKVILLAVSEIIKSSKDLQDAHGRLAKIANAEGVILEPFEKVREDQ